MADFEFPDVYHWISCLPRSSLWKFHFLPLPFGWPSALTAERTEDGCVSFFIDEYPDPRKMIWLMRDIKWSNEEDSNHNNVQVITSALLSLAIASISHAIRHPHDLLDNVVGNRGMDVSKVEEDSSYDHSSITQSSNDPLLFNSAFAFMCILISPGLFRASSVRKSISQKFALAIGVHFDTGALTRIFGSLFTFHLFECYKFVNEWEPLSWSYARNTCDRREIKIYCPLLSMIPTHNHLCALPKTSSEDLCTTLAFQQAECIVQLRYDLTFKEKFIHLQLGIHNVRCDVCPYENLPPDVTKCLISTERYFPSKICITIAPQHPSGDLSISVNRSSANPTFQIATVDGWEASYQAPKNFGVKSSASTSSTRSISSWEFEALAEGVNGTYQWILYDNSNVSGTEVISSKPSRVPFYKSKATAWYRDRYRKAASPFNKQGGVVFASDLYGKPFTWTLSKSMEGQTFKCKIEGTIWLTYWPNLRDTSFYESRYHKFCEIIELPLTRES